MAPSQAHNQVINQLLPKAPQSNFKAVRLLIYGLINKMEEK